MSKMDIALYLLVGAGATWTAAIRRPSMKARCSSQITSNEAYIDDTPPWDPKQLGANVVTAGRVTGRGYAQEEKPYSKFSNII